jgi:hypothetical protein
MGIFKDDDDESSGGLLSGSGSLGTPTHDQVEDPAGGTQEGMVVSGGGVADPSEDEATAAGDRGLG